MPCDCKWLAQLKQDITVCGGLPITATLHTAQDQSATLLLTVLGDHCSQRAWCEGRPELTKISLSPTAAAVLRWCTRPCHTVMGRDLGVSAHWCLFPWLKEKVQCRSKGEGHYFEKMCCSLFLKRKRSSHFRIVLLITNYLQDASSLPMKYQRVTMPR